MHTKQVSIGKAKILQSGCNGADKAGGSNLDQHSHCASLAFTTSSDNHLEVSMVEFDMSLRTAGACHCAAACIAQMYQATTPPYA